MRTTLHKGVWFLAVVLAAGLLAAPVYADGLAVIVQRIDASQFPNVRAYVSVANANGIPITGLDAQAFQVQEDGKPVDGLTVEPVVDSQEPILTALVIDVSGSMNDQRKLERAKDAAVNFIDALGPNDRLSVISFASEVTVVQDYTADKALLKKAIGSLVANGNTLLYDAVVQAARRQANQPERRRPVIVLTDGEDTASAASVETAIAAATNASSVVYTIGVGDEVNKDALGQIATGTAGQALYVSDPADLKSRLLSINENLRRQYVLRYTSKLSADKEPHGLAAQATFAGQQATSLKSFTMPAPPTITVGGLNTTSSVSGIQHVTVDVTGGAQLIQLVVENQVVGTSRSAPAAFDWDTAREAAGPRKVVVRVTDMQGASSDKPFSVTVAAPVQVIVATAAPTQVFVPTTGPIAVAATATPITAGPIGASIDNGLIVGIVLLLFLVAGTAWYLSRGSGLRFAPLRSSGPATQVRGGGDITDIVAGGAARGGGTIVRGFNRAKPAPQVRLKIVHGVTQTEVATRDSPITLGRARDKATVPIDDPLVSGEHVRIRRDGVQFSLEVLRTKNGTKLNGEPIDPDTRRALKSNDQIYMGDTVVTFVVDSH